MDPLTLVTSVVQSVTGCAKPMHGLLVPESRLAFSNRIDGEFLLVQRENHGHVLD